MQHAVAQASHATTPAGYTRSIAALLHRRRRILTLVFVLTLAPVVAAACFWPPMYYAGASVIIGNMEPGNGPSGGLATLIEKLGDPADLQSQIFIAKSPRMLRLALEHTGVIATLQEDCRQRISSRLGLSDCDGLEPSSQKALDYLSGHSSVSSVQQSRIISISYRSPLPRAAFILANTLMITYLEDQRGENAGIRESASAWLLEPGKRAGH